MTEDDLNVGVLYTDVCRSVIDCLPNIITVSASCLWTVMYGLLVDCTAWTACGLQCMGCLWTLLYGLLVDCNV